MDIPVCCRPMFSFLLGIDLEVGLLGHLVTLCLTFGGSARLFSKAPALCLHCPEQCINGNVLLLNTYYVLDPVPEPFHFHLL